VRSATFSEPPLCLILAALLLSFASCGSGSDRTFEETFEQFYTIEPTTDVSIRNRDGIVRVYGSPANEMEVQATKSAYTPKRLKQIGVHVSVHSGSVSIETNFPPKPTWGLFDRSGTVEYTIVVPQTANILRLKSGNGEVVVEGMRGQTLNAQLERGRMLARNCFSNAVLSLGRGTLNLTYEWWEPGRFSIQANVANGTALAFLPGSAAFHLIAETADGNIANDFADRNERHAQEISKVETLFNGGGEAVINLQAGQGDIKVVRTNP
jgi:DUF4097 and DUF4098 domain-containing protein YvlB